MAILMNSKEHNLPHQQMLCKASFRHFFVFVCFYLLQKYIDIFAGTFGFWLFGYAVSANTDGKVLGEEQDYIFWFFRVSPL